MSTETKHMAYIVKLAIQYNLYKGGGAVHPHWPSDVYISLLFFWHLGCCGGGSIRIYTASGLSQPHSKLLFAHCSLLPAQNSVTVLYGSSGMQQQGGLPPARKPRSGAGLTCCFCSSTLVTMPTSPSEEISVSVLLLYQSSIGGCTCLSWM